MSSNEVLMDLGGVGVNMDRVLYDAGGILAFCIFSTSRLVGGLT